jgi:ribosomal protein S16
MREELYVPSLGDVVSWAVWYANAECRSTEKDGNKHLLLNIERSQYWLAQGARPSDTVSRIFGQIGVLPPLPFRPRQPRGTKNPDKRRSTSE